VRICVDLPDPQLRRALIDLLRSAGHAAAARDDRRSGWDLEISTRLPPVTAEVGRTRLILQRWSDPVANRDPRGALEAALRNQGTVVWRAPLDTRLLVEVLGKGVRSESPPAMPTEGALEEAPHPWLLLDPRSGTIEAWNELASHLFERAGGTPRLSELPLAADLQEALTSESEGVRFDELSGRGHITVWWTNRRGFRVACLLEALPAQSAAARHRQSLAELGTMAATLAHEIRNPVASLAGALDLLETETDPDDRAEVLGMARERLRQLARLLDKTLTLSRPLTGPAEAVEMQPAIESALFNLSLDPALEGVEILFDMPAAPVPVQAFEGPLIQALTNLLLNAAQAQEGIGKIHISLLREGRQAVLRIADEGPGIPQDKHREVFKPFYTTRASGTGLGLAEVRRAVNAMGGTVNLEDSKKGACFRIELPLATRQSPAP
jgi:signal transduction histidine kinase